MNISLEMIKALQTTSSQFRWLSSDQQNQLKRIGKFNCLSLNQQGEWNLITVAANDEFHEELRYRLRPGYQEPEAKPKVVFDYKFGRVQARIDKLEAALRQCSDMIDKKQLRYKLWHDKNHTLCDFINETLAGDEPTLKVKTWDDLETMEQLGQVINDGPEEIEATTLPEPTLPELAELLMSARADLVIHKNYVAATGAISLALDLVAKMEGSE